MSTEGLLQLLLKTLILHRWLASFDVLAATLVVYDTLLNFDNELHFIWASPWTSVKVLYLVQRYLPFVDVVILLVYYQSLTDPKQCLTTMRIIGWLSFAGALLAEALMSIRVWAVWGRSRYILACLGILYIGCFTPGAFYFGKFIQGVAYGNPPFPISNREGCLIVGGNNLLYITWTMFAVYDTASFILMMIPVARAYRRGGRSSVIRIIYQDGIKYSVFLSAFSLMNIVVMITCPSFVFLLSSVERVFHSVIASRAILHIRQQSDTQGVYVGSGEQFQLRSPYVGNRGQVSSKTGQNT
ncbi:hypothetical protein PM082_011395 [Marasmius tenuissimus]|nr:hypothetical protein PM082_011395 [Marasmius tenuissimus]